MAKVKLLIRSTNKYMKICEAIEEIISNAMPSPYLRIKDYDMQYPTNIVALSLGKDLKFLISFTPCYRLSHYDDWNLIKGNDRRNMPFNSFSIAQCTTSDY